jgi:DNA polymerase zeta
MSQLTRMSVNRYIAQLTRSLNHAMALSMKRNPNSPHAQFIRAIVLVKGVHFYGFHASYAPFLKILFTDPALTTRAVTLMQSGTIMHTRFQVFESHLSFTLQFMCDFGLYGCGWLDLGDIWERASNEEDVTTEGSHDNQQPRFKPSPYFRSTRMPLEIDVAAHQILNRHSLYARDIHHTLTIPQPPLPPEPLVPSVRELWDDERIRRTARGMSPTPEMPIDPSASSRSVGGEWIAEARWWDELRARIERERATNPPVLPPKEWERWIMSTFESVEALWDDEWKSWKPKAAKSQSTPNGQADAASEEGSNPFAEALGSAQSQSTKDEDDINTANVDMHMLASQALHTQIVENERHDKRYDNVTAQQVDDVPEDEDLPPLPPATPRGTPRQPLDEQTSLDEEIPSTPTKSKRSADNLFLSAWNKIGA